MARRDWLHYAHLDMRDRPERIRLATWNCFGAPQSLDDFLDGRPFWPERLEASPVLETLSSYDIVCVQENMLDGVRERLTRLGEAAGFHEPWFDPMGPSGEDKTLVSGGLLILSRFPMRTHFVRLPRGVGPDAYARKGFALAEVRLPGGRELYVANTHLQADDARISLEECKAVRWAQLEALRDGLLPLLRDGAPVVLCGDLNVAWGSEEYERAARLFGEHMVDVVGPAGFATYDVGRNDVAAAFHEGGPEQALIDYVWAARRHIATRRTAVILDEPLPGLPGAPEGFAGRAFASDHFGVGVVMEIG
jgi:endonuclease/exonuclease/phosphatase family metal-dependent hydrolase